MKILDSISTAVLLLNNDNRVVYLNTAMRELCVSNPQGFDNCTLGVLVSDVLHDDNLLEKEIFNINLSHHLYEVKAVQLEQEIETCSTILEWRDISSNAIVEKEVGKIISAALGGNLSIKIDTKNMNGFMKEVSTSINLLLDSIQKPLNEIKSVLSEVATGKLISRMEGFYFGEFSLLKDATNRSLYNLESMITQVKKVTIQVNKIVTTISQGNSLLETRSHEQTNALNDASGKLQILKISVDSNKQSTGKLNILYENTLANATEGVAPVIVHEIEEILKSIKKLGITTIIVEQNAVAALKLADRAVILDMGKIVFDGTAQEVLDDEELRHEYLAI